MQFVNIFLWRLGVVLIIAVVQIHAEVAEVLGTLTATPYITLGVLSATLVADINLGF
jgi:hypothetical protein